MNDLVKIGTVGLGLMGSSIAACILAAGHTVISVDTDQKKRAEAAERITEFLQQLHDEGLLKEAPEAAFRRLTITDILNDLSGVEIIVEAITENTAAKKALYKNLETIVSETVIIASNTSAIPVTMLQEDMEHPERLLGLHWAEPAHITRFMEIICGKQTNITYAQQIYKLAEGWGKEPSLLKKDIRGFITNRIMYAMMREALFLVENGYADIEDVDRSVRNDLGSWITLAGPFRFMDLTGIPAYLTVMEGLFPELDTAKKPSKIMTELVASGALGVSNAKGFYPYNENTARLWEEKFQEFSFDIRKLTEKYSPLINELEKGG